MTRRAVAAITLGAGALLVVLGSLFPLYGSVTSSSPGIDGHPPGRAVVALSPWELIQEPAPRVAEQGDFPVYGYSLVAAALLVGVGALLQFRSPLQAAVGRFAALVGFGLLVGTVWTALETLRLLFGGPPADADDGGFVGSGTWVLVGAGVVVLVGAVLAQDWPARVPRPAGVSVYQVEDDDTPPFGIAIPVDEPDPARTDHGRHPTG